MKLGGLARKDDRVVRDVFQKAFNEVRLYPQNNASVAVISSYWRSLTNSASTPSVSLPRRLSSKTTLSARTKSRGLIAGRPTSSAMLASARWIFS